MFFHEGKGTLKCLCSRADMMRHSCTCLANFCQPFKKIVFINVSMGAVCTAGNRNLLFFWHFQQGCL